MFRLPFFKKKVNSIKPVVLVVLDGFGIAPPSQGNAITTASTPNLDNYKKTYPYAELIAAGESMGLPANEAGNSEVGHLTLGVGRIIYQSLPRINMSIEDGSFYDNRALHKTLDHLKKYNSNLHIMGLVGNGTVHSSTEHLYALLDFCYRNKLRNVRLHLFTDGRDSPPTDGINVVKQIDEKINDLKVAQICTVSGRYYAMDRDARWDRTKVAYDAIVSAIGPKARSAEEAMENSYSSGKTDEFIMPTIITSNTPQQAYNGVNDNDAVIFFNFRIDRPRQLTMAFIFPDFENLKSVKFGYVPHESKKQKLSSEGPTFTRSKWPRNMFFVTMTEYQKNLPVSAICFPPQDARDSLPEVLSKLGMRQLHLAESEKERMVTFYFDGMREEKFPGEDDVIVPSPNVATYDLKPEMSADGIVKELKKAMKKDIYQFIVINFANPDMVAHSGNIQATLKAVTTVDKSVGEIVSETVARDGCVFVTADHGNAEELLTFPTGSFFFTSSEGSVNTEHSNNPVPLYIITKRFAGMQKNLPPGTLADVAPTILSYMGIEKPQGMTGKDLLSELRNTGSNVQPKKKENSSGN